MTVTVGDSGLRCCVCVMSLERKLTPLFVDSARALCASFCLRTFWYIFHGCDFKRCLNGFNNLTAGKWCQFTGENGQRYQHVLALCALLTGVVEILCLMFVYVCFVLCL